MLHEAVVGKLGWVGSGRVSMQQTYQRHQKVATNTTNEKRNTKRATKRETTFHFIRTANPTKMKPSPQHCSITVVVTSHQCRCPLQCSMCLCHLVWVTTLVGRIFGGLGGGKRDKGIVPNAVGFLRRPIEPLRSRLMIFPAKMTGSSNQLKTYILEDGIRFLIILAAATASV